MVALLENRHAEAARTVGKRNTWLGFGSPWMVWRKKQTYVMINVPKKAASDPRNVSMPTLTGDKVTRSSDGSVNSSLSLLTETAMPSSFTVPSAVTHNSSPDHPDV